MREIVSPLVGIRSPFRRASGGPAGPFGSGTTGGILLGDAETAGLAVDFLATTPDLLIRSVGGSLDYSGDPFGKFTYARASVATRINSSGFLETVTSGTARLEHEFGTGTRLGLLLEESRTNVVLWNCDLTNAVWTHTNVTATQDQTGPDNTANSATRLTATGASGTSLQTTTIASSVRSQSAWVKRITGSGTIEMTMDNGTTWTVISPTASWTRVSIPTQTIANPIVGFRITTSGDEIAVYGVQNENGGVVTSTILTTTATVNRVPDTCTIATTLFPWADSAAGTLVLNFVTADIVATNAGLVGISLNTSNNVFIGSNAGTPLFVYRLGGANQASISIGSAMTAGARAKMAGAFDTNDFQAARDTVLGTADVTGTLGLGATTLNLRNNGTGGVPARALIVSQFTYVPRRMANAELQTRTT